MRTKVGRYYHTIRYLKPWQVVGRLVAKVKRILNFNLLPTPPKHLSVRYRSSVPFPTHDTWNNRESILAGEFTFLSATSFLSTTSDQGVSVDWSASHMPLLWRFNLHYFHYLFRLHSSERLALCRDWIANNPIGCGVGWHSYPTSLRIVNWCKCQFLEQDILESLYTQAGYLYRNVETYVSGNHLLENARALNMAATVFEEDPEAIRWADRALAIYEQELPVQILPDGGHYERSPMYHGLVLEGILDTINCLPKAHALLPILVDKVTVMSDVLVSMTHPDGQLTLFNDSTQEIALSPSELTNYVQSLVGHQPTHKNCFPETGYFVYRDDTVYISIDGGVAGPDHLMAHAHADCFSYELSLFDRQFIVDTGVFEYAAGSMRDYVRSTSAHNTLAVDGINQIECWNSFRVARRFAPNDVKFNVDNNEARFEGTYAGFAKLIGDGIQHHRSIDINRKERIVTIRDRVDGRCRHTVESRIHLHPAVTIRRTDNGVNLSVGDRECSVELDETSVIIEDGWYCPRFGNRLTNKVLVLSADGHLPQSLWYRIRY